MSMRPAPTRAQPAQVAASQQTQGWMLALLLAGLIGAKDKPASLMSEHSTPQLLQLLLWPGCPLSTVPRPVLSASGLLTFPQALEPRLLCPPNRLLLRALTQQGRCPPGEVGETHTEMTIPGTMGWVPQGPVSTLRGHRPERTASGRDECGFLEEVALMPIPKGHWALSQQAL